MSITLYTFGSYWDLPDISPFCTKLETYLRLAGISFTKKPGNPQKAPKGKLPYIRHDDQLIGDSHFIIEHLERSFSVDLNAHLSDAERGIATAYQVMLEESLYFALLHFRWGNDAAWTEYKVAIAHVMRSAGAPRFLIPLLLPVLRRGVRKSLYAQGMGRHSEDEIAAIGRRELQSVSELLGDKLFLFGDQPSNVDATVFGMLSGLFLAPVDTPLREAALAFPNLQRYCDHIHQHYFA